MAGANDPVVARSRRRRRPGAVLERAATGRHRKAGVAPCQANRAQARERLFVEQELTPFRPSC